MIAFIARVPTGSPVQRGTFGSRPKGRKVCKIAKCSQDLSDFVVQGIASNGFDLIQNKNYNKIGTIPHPLDIFWGTLTFSKHGVRFYEEIICNC